MRLRWSNCGVSVAPRKFGEGYRQTFPARFPEKPFPVQPWCPPDMKSAGARSAGMKSACCYGHRWGLDWEGLGKEKRPRLHAAVWNFSDTRGVLVLAFQYLLFGCRGLGSSRAGRGLRGRRLGSCATGRRGGYARLRVVNIDHRLGDVASAARHQNRALRPGLGSVDDHAEAIILGVFHDDGSHLLEHTAGDFLLLRAELFLRILHRAIEQLLLGLDLLLQRGQGVFVQLLLLRAELLLQAVQFVVLILELGLLWLELLAQVSKIAAAFVAAEDSPFNVDGSHLGPRPYRSGGGSGSGRRGDRAGRSGGAAGLGPIGKRERKPSG